MNLKKMKIGETVIASTIDVYTFVSAKDRDKFLKVAEKNDWIKSIIAKEDYKEVDRFIVKFIPNPKKRSRLSEMSQQLGAGVSRIIAEVSDVL